MTVSLQNLLDRNISTLGMSNLKVLSPAKIVVPPFRQRLFCFSLGDRLFIIHFEIQKGSGNSLVSYLISLEEMSIQARG